MALPTLITVVGTLPAIDGTPARGHVAFYSSVPVLSSEDETVVIPSYKLAVLDETGAFEVAIPASDDPDWTPVGWTYKVVVNYNGNKYTFDTVIPYDAVDGEIRFSDLVPALDGGSELYAAFSHTHEGGGGSTAWNDITGKPSTFPPSTHTHPQSDVTGLVADLSGKAATVHTHAISDVTDLQTALDDLEDTIIGIDFPVDSVAGKTGVVTLVKGDVGLGNVDNTSDLAKPVSTATQTALDAKADDSEITSLDSRVDALEAAGSTMVVRRSKITSGNITLPNTAGSWAALSGGPTLVIPAAVGDYIEFNVMGMRTLGASSFLDPAVLVSGSPVRYSSTGTGTPALEGNPETYPNPGEFLGMTTIFEFEAESGDISGGNITIGFGVKANGTGTLYQSTDYPLRLRVTNYGPVDVA